MMHIVILKRKVIKRTILIIAIIVLLILGLVSGKNVISSNGINKKSIPIYSVGTDKKVVAITFDTSWGSDNTEKIINVLKQQNIRATFFVIGKWLDEYPDYVKLILSYDNEVGNHSDGHKEYTRMSKEEIIKDISTADEKIYKLTGKKPTLFRFPEGTYDDRTVKIVEDTGHKCIQWDVDSIDWRNDGEEIEYKRVIKKVKNGSIILFHNSGKYTVATLNRVINELKKEGYSFEKVSELIYNENYNIDENGKQIKNRVLKFK